MSDPAESSLSYRLLAWPRYLILPTGLALLFFLVLGLSKVAVASWGNHLGWRMEATAKVSQVEPVTPVLDSHMPPTAAGVSEASGNAVRSSTSAEAPVASSPAQATKPCAAAHGAAALPRIKPNAQPCASATVVCCPDQANPNLLGSQALDPSKTPEPSKPPEPSAADVLSTLSLVVAMVSLILTWGSSWMHQQGERMRRLIDQQKSDSAKQVQTLNDKLGELHSANQLLELQSRAQALWAKVPDELVRHLVGTCRNPSTKSIYFGFLLLRLLDVSAHERGKAFGEIYKALRPQLKQGKESEFPALAGYLMACHALAKVRQPSEPSFTLLFNKVAVAEWEEWERQLYVQAGNTTAP